MAILMLYLLIIAAGMITAMKIKDGFGKLLASGLVFTMAFQVFTVVGGITLVIPLTGLTLPYMAAGGSSLIANYMLAALLVVISNSANKPESDIDSDTFQYEAMQALRARKQSPAPAEASPPRNRRPLKSSPRRRRFQARQSYHPLPHRARRTYRTACQRGAKHE